MIDIKFAEDFTKTPGGRYKSEGQYSGEEFRERILIPKFKEAVESKQRIMIDFDGVYGLPPSFLEEAFGGAQRVLPDVILLDYLAPLVYIPEAYKQDYRKIIEYISEAYLSHESEASENE